MWQQSFCQRCGFCFSPNSPCFFLLCLATPSSLGLLQFLASPPVLQRFPSSIRCFLQTTIIFAQDPAPGFAFFSYPLHSRLPAYLLVFFNDARSYPAPFTNLCRLFPFVLCVPLFFFPPFPNMNWVCFPRRGHSGCLTECAVTVSPSFFPPDRLSCHSSPFFF